MKLTWRGMVLEGTVEEIEKIIQNIEKKSEQASAKDTERDDADDASEVSGEKKYVSVKFARHMLKRRNLSVEQLLVLTTLYNSEEPVLATELQSALSYSTRQFSGLMGAFGRRLTHTDGYEQDSWFFVQEWQMDKGCNAYSLPPSVREALEKEALV
jgi:hypothetical protein